MTLSVDTILAALTRFSSRTKGYLGLVSTGLLVVSRRPTLRHTPRLFVCLQGKHRSIERQLECAGKSRKTHTLYISRLVVWYMHHYLHICLRLYVEKSWFCEFCFMLFPHWCNNLVWPLWQSVFSRKDIFYAMTHFPIDAANFIH